MFVVFPGGWSCHPGWFEYALWPDSNSEWPLQRGSLSATGAATYVTGVKYVHGTGGKLNPMLLKKMFMYLHSLKRVTPLLLYWHRRVPVYGVSGMEDFQPALQWPVGPVVESTKKCRANRRMDSQQCRFS